MPTIEQLTNPLRRETDVHRFVGSIAEAANCAVDLVAPQSALRYRQWGVTGQHSLMIESSEPILLPDGVASHLQVTHTRTAWRHVAERLGIPLGYLDRISDHDASPVSGHLTRETINTLSSVEQRNALYRLWKADDGYVLRAVLSDRYGAFDNADALRAITSGMEASGVSLGDCEIDVDFTSDRFRMRIAVPQVAEYAPDLLDGYRSPFSFRGSDPHAPARADEGAPPVVWAGLEIANSETGAGRFTLAPRILILVCRNGLVRPIEVARTHLGASLDPGVVRWSAETQRRSLELVTSQVADAVSTYVNVDYVRSVIGEMRNAKQYRVTNTAEAIQVVQKSVGFTDAETDSILDAFSRSGEATVFGLGQAVTAAAQTVADGDRQSEMEEAAWRVFRLGAAAGELIPAYI